ncbi:deoxynucleoside kinase [Ralstonia solanacearum]|uniref:deoxynucleoside kinase n=1 Tax=Ralstonia solanacearum TaxID=305 RepID=UPI0018D191C4|nr:deoxynucleoside kinase [Ralstonia solanacearum]
MALDHLRRIVVEGPIGVGKTALAQRLADHLRAATLFETPEDNPFLARFYEEPARYALPVQLRFLLQRTQRLAAWHKATLAGERIVADSFLPRDRLFAQLTLPADELVLYDAMARALAPPPQRIDLVVCLQARAEDLLPRIARRAVPFETGIDVEYLERICAAYGELFLYYDAAPTLIVDTAAFDPAGNDDDFRTLLTRIDAMRGPKEFIKLATR